MDPDPQFYFALLGVQMLTINLFDFKDKTKEKF